MLINVLDNVLIKDGNELYNTLTNALINPGTILINIKGYRGFVAFPAGGGTGTVPVTVRAPFEGVLR